MRHDLYSRLRRSRSVLLLFLQAAHLLTPGSSAEARALAGRDSLNDTYRTHDFKPSRTKAFTTDWQDDRWVVVWKGTSYSDEACLEAHTPASGRFNGVCFATFNHVMSGFAAQFTRSQLEAFLAAYEGQVAGVHEDGYVSIDSVQYSAPWALDRIDQTDLPLDQLYHYYNTGSKVNVYIVDTGIRITHAQFGYADGTAGSRADEVYTSLQSGSEGEDCNGHGTHVAATVGGLTFGPAKNALLHAVRALECAGNGTVSQVIEGLDWVKAHRKSPAVVVMALGGESLYALDLAVRDVVLSGISVVVAAGNMDADACTKSPAREPLSITVAAMDSSDQRLWLEPGKASNYGKCVHVWAPGAHIVSASNESDTATAYRSGTSQAVPFVAGAIALYLQNASDPAAVTPEEINTVLAASGDWNKVVESPSSGDNDVLDSADNILLNTNLFAGVAFKPQNLSINGNTDGFGPYNISVSLAQKPTAPVQAVVELSEEGRGQLSPKQVQWTASTWQQPQSITLSVASQVWATVSSGQFYVVLQLQSRDPAFDGRRPRIRVDDRKGDTVAYPKAVLRLPFVDDDNTYFYNDDYQVRCQGDYNDTGGGKDVVYYFAPKQSGSVIFSLCGSAKLASNFDTKLYVLANVNNVALQPAVAVACNDDGCGYQSQLQMNVEAGLAYAVIVDGFNGNFGEYSLSITASNAQAEMEGSEPLYGYTNAITGPQSIAPSLQVSSGQPPYVVAQTPGLQLGSITTTASEGAHSTDDQKAYPPPSPAAPITGGATPDEEEPPPAPPVQSDTGSVRIPSTFVDPIQNQPITSLARPAEAPSQGPQSFPSGLRIGLGPTAAVLQPGMPHLAPSPAISGISTSSVHGRMPGRTGSRRLVMQEAPVVPCSQSSARARHIEPAHLDTQQREQQQGFAPDQTTQPLQQEAQPAPLPDHIAGAPIAACA